MALPENNGRARLAFDWNGQGSPDVKGFRAFRHVLGHTSDGCLKLLTLDKEIVSIPPNHTVFEDPEPPYYRLEKQIVLEVDTALTEPRCTIYSHRVRPQVRLRPGDRITILDHGTWIVRAVLTFSPDMQAIAIERPLDLS